MAAAVGKWPSTGPGWAVSKVFGDQPCTGVPLAELGDPNMGDPSRSIKYEVWTEQQASVPTAAQAQRERAREQANTEDDREEQQQSEEAEARGALAPGEGDGLVCPPFYSTPQGYGLVCPGCNAEISSNPVYTGLRVLA